MRFLLKPGWLAFIAVVLLFTVACYTLLAPWQFRRNAQREAQNTAIAASFVHPPQPLAELVPPGTAPGADVEWRKATVTGRYLPADEAVVRLRSVLGRPAFEVLTPLRTDTGRTIVVNRGFVQPTRGTQVPDYAPPPEGTVRLTGRIRLDETDLSGREALRVGGHLQLYAADSRTLAAATGLSLSGGYLQLIDGQPGVLRALPLPDQDSGPFLSYAWQWLTFGVMALFGLGYFIRLEMLQRRRPEDGGPDRGPPEPEREVPLADRYGRSRR